MPIKFFLEYSKGGIFIPVDDELGRQLTRERRTVRRLETGATIEAYYNGERIQVRMQKLAPSEDSTRAAAMCECRFQPSNGKKHHDSCPAAFENKSSENSDA